MKKTGSTGDLFNYMSNDKKVYKNLLRPATSTHYNFQKKSSPLIPSNMNQINSFEEYPSLLLQINYNNNIENSLLNKTSKQLYDELMALKRKVNFLNSEISLAKSTKRKKDVQINIKNKEIECYLSDIKM